MRHGSRKNGEKKGFGMLLILWFSAAASEATATSSGNLDVDVNVNVNVDTSLAVEYEEPLNLDSTPWRSKVPEHLLSLDPVVNVHSAERELLLDTSRWPFSSASNNSMSKVDNSCGIYQSCFDCATASSWCHWCQHDNVCHEKRSVYGCLEGVTCVNKTEPHKEDKGCGVHKTCGECAISSIGCHWCAADNACHAIGSIYGCVTGVDCYSNDRCRRQQPAAIRTLTFQEMGFGPFLVVLFLASICLCCSTLGFCVAGSVKGAYDDLVEATVSNNFQTHHHLLPLPGIASAETEDELVVEETNEDTDLLLQSEDVESGSDYNLMNEVDPRSPPLHPSQIRSARSSGSKHMNCLFNACRACYVVNLATIFAFVVCSIRYYPKIPQYNICNDSLAWKSLVDSMTSLSIVGSFEILASVKNPNHFDVALDMVRGTFAHKGANVGTFEIPPTVIAAMAITDLAIVASFAPDKWETFSLTEEYYRGTLAFTIDAQSMIRLPFLFDYSKEADINRMYVKVNDPNLKDRHLCACPNWDDLKNKTTPLTF
jgi:hypothetical protein